MKERLYQAVARAGVLCSAIAFVVACTSAGRADPSTIKIGVWVKPKQAGPATIGDLERAIGRKFDYAMHYERIDAPFPSDAIADDKANGRVPIVSVGCGEIAGVSQGQDDAQFRTLATSMARYGAPIEFRYCWEMNLKYRHIEASDFVPAWKHVHDLFAAAGARNVRFYFCPGAERGRAARGLAYYPGDGYVDDIGVDVYDRKGEGFDAMLGEAYGVYANIDKPFIIGETGALSEQDQASFLTPDTVSLIRQKYPHVRGIVYFDAGGPHGDWSLAGPGLSAFGAFAKAAEH